MKRLIRVSAQIPKDLADKLNKIAKFYKKPKSFFIRKALEKYIIQKIKNIKKLHD